MELPTSDAETIVLLLNKAEDVKTLSRTKRWIDRALDDRRRELTELLMLVEHREGR